MTVFLSSNRAFCSRGSLQYLAVPTKGITIPLIFSITDHGLPLIHILNEKTLHCPQATWGQRGYSGQVQISTDLDLAIEKAILFAASCRGVARRQQDRPEAERAAVERAVVR
ncbi:hypothetical protein PM082_003521 [Marasmius tenuissimus]|nr:hypothetical protein PM082_003521 [Marasmius tenuissimus]